MHHVLMDALQPNLCSMFVRHQWLEPDRVCSKQLAMRKWRLAHGIMRGSVYWYYMPPVAASWTSSGLYRDRAGTTCR